MELYQIGAITATHGVKGEVKVFPTTDDVKRYDDLKSFYLNDSESADGNDFLEKDYNIVSSIKYVKNTPILKIKGIDSIEDAYKAVDASGNKLGYVFVIITKEGYGGDIQLSMGVTNDGTINGIEFLSLSETAGLGMNADTDDFKSQFAGMHVAQVSFTKTGKQNDYEIDAISGATITTTAVTKAVNGGLYYFQSLNGGAN